MDGFLSLCGKPWSLLLENNLSIKRVVKSSLVKIDFQRASQSINPHYRVFLTIMPLMMVITPTLCTPPVRYIIEFCDLFGGKDLAPFNLHLRLLFE